MRKQRQVWDIWKEENSMMDVGDWRVRTPWVVLATFSLETARDLLAKAKEIAGNIIAIPKVWKNPWK